MHPIPIPSTTDLGLNAAYEKDIGHWALSSTTYAACSVEPGSAEDVGKIVCRHSVPLYDTRPRGAELIFVFAPRCSCKLLARTRRPSLYVTSPRSAPQGQAEQFFLLLSTFCPSPAASSRRSRELGGG